MALRTVPVQVDRQLGTRHPRRQRPVEPSGVDDPVGHTSGLHQTGKATRREEHELVIPTAPPQRTQRGHGGEQVAEPKSTQHYEPRPT